MTAKIIIDDVEESSIIDVEVRPSGARFPAVGFSFDESADMIRITVGTSDNSIESIDIPVDTFWNAVVALTRDNLTTELEELANDSSIK